MSDIKITPRDSVDALRLMKVHQAALLQPGDTPEVKEQIKATIATFLAMTRAKLTNLEFIDWYENADMGDLVEEDEGADPTE